MDDDLQHDPADIPSLVSGLNKGNDVCFANFSSKKQSLLKNFGSWLNDKLSNVLLDKPKNIYLSSYKAIKREIIDEVKKYDGPYPNIDGLILRVTQNLTQENIRHHQRFSGKGNYNFIRSFKEWLKMVTSFSVFPLRIATFIGFISSSMGFILGILFLLEYFIGEKAPPGWFTLVMTILFFGGIQLLTLGIIGEYLGRTYLNINNQPQFIIKDKINLK